MDAADAPASKPEASDPLRQQTPPDSPAPGTPPATAPTQAAAPALADTESPPPLSTKKVHVVVVHADSAFANGIKAHFESKGSTAQVFGSVAELKAAKLDKPSLFVVGMNLNGEDGRSLAKDLKDDGTIGPDCPMVLVTDAPLDKEGVAFSLNMGFRKILKSPFPFDFLERGLGEERPQKKPESKINRPVEAPFKAPPKNDTTKIITRGQTTTLPATKAFSSAGKTVILEKEPSAPPSLVKPIVLGIAFSAGVAIVLGVAMPDGYTNSFMLGEGVLLGIAAGFGLCSEFKRMSSLPPPLTVGGVVLLTTFAGWVLMMIVRSVMGGTFVERTAAMMEHMNEQHDWGSTEYSACFYIISQLIVAYIAAMAVVHASLKNR